MAVAGLQVGSLITVRHESCICRRKISTLHCTTQWPGYQLLYTVLLLPISWSLVTSWRTCETRRRMRPLTGRASTRNTCYFYWTIRVGLQFTTLPPAAFSAALSSTFPHHHSRGPAYKFRARHRQVQQIQETRLIVTTSYPYSVFFGDILRETN